MSPVTFTLFSFIISCAVFFDQGNGSTSQSRGSSQWSTSFDDRMQQMQTRLNENIRRAQEQAFRAQERAARAVALANVRVRQAQAQAHVRQTQAQENVRQAQAQAQAQMTWAQSEVNEYSKASKKGEVTHDGPGFRKRVIELDNGRIVEMTMNHVSPDGRTRSHARSYVATFKN